VTAAFAALTLFCTPAVSHLALGSLEWRYPPLEQRPDDAGVIVVLSAGVIGPDEPGGRAELDEDTVRRCFHAARLYRQGRPCPVVVSGGKVEEEKPGPPCAELMRDLLVQFGVPPSDVLVESASRTTYENAVECRQLLTGRALNRVVLVADAVDLYRAVLCFRKQGVEPVPSASWYRARRFEWSLFAFLPSPEAARANQRVWHEWLGVLWYRLRDRV
jgi:uncharacterized SAM-binding protein YcdF (DUF218 family)